MPPSELPAAQGLDLLSELNSSVRENGSRARCEGVHASSVPFVATEHKQQKVVRLYRKCYDSLPDNDNA